MYFVRHGQTDWNAEGRLQGGRDIPLNDLGRAQAARNGRRLAELIGAPDRFHFVASPLARARETMALIRREMGLTPDDYATDNRLTEIAFGDWEGRRWADLHAEEPDALAMRARDPFGFRPPGKAESYADLTRRVAAWVAGLEGGQALVVVSHGGVSRALRGHLLALPRHQIPELRTPQDEVLRIDGREIDWL
ncbi:MAG: histidine phosphatase family protein [Rhizobiales bacterium]|nr:histidine phosphatase family protein [Hyphomicrobiales bacterium]